MLAGQGTKHLLDDILFTMLARGGSSVGCYPIAGLGAAGLRRQQCFVESLR